jgi:sugar O-acyltransferase (sialic acid O-acetyltransferase NeuD family)
MKLAIIGAGELGKLVAHHAIHDSKFEVVGYYDDFKKEGNFNGFPLIGKINDAFLDFNSNNFDKIFIAIGYAQMPARELCYKKFKAKIPLANIIHTSSYIDISCKIGEGICILPGCTLDYGVEIEDNVLLNTGVIIAHHTKVGTNTFVAPAVQMAGLITIEENCFIGIGATIKDCIRIGKKSIIGAGAVVVKNTSENSTSIGLPAKEL